MKSSLEKGKAQRLRISELYESGWQFVIRLLMGFGIYVILRVLLITFMVNKLMIPYYLNNPLMELILLLMTAVLMLAFFWLRGTRLQFAATVWMPVMACLAISGWIHFILTFIRFSPAEALFGILPFVLPLTLFVFLWIFPPLSRLPKILASIVLALLCAFWAIDIPGTRKVLESLHPVITAYGEFYTTLQKEHIVSGANAPDRLVSGRIASSWKYREVDPADYRSDEAIPGILHLAYVEEAAILIPAGKEGRADSFQELKFSSLETLSLHYLYKYTTRRVIVIKDFQFSGDAFFRAELTNGETVFLDNVVIRKK